jgi:hypothetical protein
MQMKFYKVRTYQFGAGALIYQGDIYVKAESENKAAFETMNNLNKSTGVSIRHTAEAVEVGEAEYNENTDFEELPF